MNITSVVVSAALMGTMAPAVANMSLQPMMATKRANNFSVAESSVVTFSAKAEKDNVLPEVPDHCELGNLGDGAYSITCVAGEDSSNRLSLVPSGLRMMVMVTLTQPEPLHLTHLVSSLDTNVLLMIHGV